MWKLPRSLFLGADIVDVLWSTDRVRPRPASRRSLSLSWVFPLVAFGVTSLPVAENGGERGGSRRGGREGDREEEPKEEEALAQIFRPQSHTWALG